ncbi:MAG: hypothetical protein ACJ78Q_05815 [Chloroflexia bacterium]|jgi:hypothetical protein
MKIEIDVPDYSPEGGLRMRWEEGSIISATEDGGAILIRANHEGLVSLARLLLTLVNEGVPSGAHWHLDAHNAFEDGSIEIVIEKVNS